jgi:hypothetical protein
MTRVHKHSAPLKGIPAAAKESGNWPAFHAYFSQLSKSDEEEAGWEMLTESDWGGRKFGVGRWLDETGAVGEWRSSTPPGKVDQFRVTFDVEQDIVDVFDYVRSVGDGSGRSRTTLEHERVGSSSSSFNDEETGDAYEASDIYLAVKMVWPLKPRDTRLERLEHMAKDKSKAFVLARSKQDTKEGIRLGKKKGRVRANLDMGGHFLQKIVTKYGTTTRVTYVAPPQTRARARAAEPMCDRAGSRGGSGGLPPTAPDSARFCRRRASEKEGASERASERACPA